MVAHPFKLHRFERYPAELYDTRWDRHERTNLAGQRPDVVERMTDELQPFVDATRLKGSMIAEPVSGEVLDTLRSLGYVE